MGRERTFSTLSQTMHDRQVGTMGVGTLTLTRGASSWSYTASIPEVPFENESIDGMTVSEIVQGWIIRPGDITGYVAPQQGDVLTFCGRVYRVPEVAGRDYDPAGISVRVFGVLDRGGA